jgi:hypothetical protein
MACQPAQTRMNTSRNTTCSAHLKSSFLFML